MDLFKGQSTKDPNKAMQLVKSVRDNPHEAISNLEAAVKYVSSLPFVNSSKIASIGWCFGGGQSLQLALHSEQHPLAATILYYGTPLVTDKRALSKIKWPVLGIFGDHDHANPLLLINTFKAALDNVGITNEILVYKGLGHAFANPSGTNYAPRQTADAWQKTCRFPSIFIIKFLRVSWLNNDRYLMLFFFLILYTRYPLSAISSALLISLFLVIPSIILHLFFTHNLYHLIKSADIMNLALR